MKATNHRLSDMVRHDLEKIAEQLPKIHEYHYENLIWWFKRKGWTGVDEYITLVTPLRPIQETFLSKWSKWLDRKVDWLTGLLNRLD